jgi:hypothetical protein
LQYLFVFRYVLRRTHIASVHRYKNFLFSTIRLTIDIKT